jgi:signal transduction histidine kinase
MYWPNEPIYTRSDAAVCWGPYCRIFPDKIPVLTEGLVCRLTSFKVFDREWRMAKAPDFTEEVALQYFDNTISLSWSARSFTNPEQDTFYHLLEGVDDDWVATPASRRSTSYLKLLPGNYTFRLKCKNRDGVFGPEKTLRIRIIPAFWQTWWFKLLIIGALAGVVAVIASLRQRQKRLAAELKQREAEFKQKEAEMSQRIAEYQVAALRAQMNPHFIFNSLNSINRFVQLSGPDDASNYLTKFARLIRLVLDNSRAEVISLESELEAIRLYLELESLRFAGQFEYRVRVTQDVDIEEVSVPPLFVQPYVENAVWHGLMQKAEADRQLEIHVRLDERSWLCIEISDNGIGRERAKELKSKSATRQKSHGMDITAERVRMFTERTGRQMVVQVDDLFAEGGEPCGTRVKIMLETGASNQNLP